MKSVRSRTRFLPAIVFLTLAAACSDSPMSPELDASALAARKGPKAPPPPPPPSDTTVTPPPPTSGSNPIAGWSLYVDPNSRAKQQADAWRSSRPADAAEMDKIAQQSQADWFGDWNTDVRTAVNSRVTTITNAGKLPVLVAYNIPKRDCNSYSAGGASSADAYRTWMRDFAAGIGSRKAVVILEPDALAGMTCLPLSEQQTLRLDLIRDAVTILRAQPGAVIYIDAGHSAWQTASTMASRLTSAGIGNAHGFSLNVSNYQYNSNLSSYGRAISDLLGTKHFVIDTSRNGLGPGSTWCNPAGRALGSAPTTSSGNALIDAALWIKRPGESDGTCNGGPTAGAWWADYALGLAQRSVMQLAGL